MQAWDFLGRILSPCSPPSTRRRAAAWASDCSSAARSSRTIAVVSGRSRTAAPPARLSRSPFHAVSVGSRTIEELEAEPDDILLGLIELRTKRPDKVSAHDITAE